MEEKEKKSLLSEVKSELDDLENQLKISGEEFKKTYREKKTRLATILKNYVEELEHSGSEKIKELKESSEELIELLEADYDISYSEYDSESNKISSALHAFEIKAKTLYDGVSSETSKTLDKVQKDLKESLAKFNTEMDIQAAHFKATKDRATDEFEAWKGKRLKDIESLKEKLSVYKDSAEEKVEGFGEEMQESFKHIKKAFKNLW